MSNVREFGAAGDGQRDDTAAILHAVQDGDGLLEFPPGRYRITRPIAIDLGAGECFAVQGSGGTARLIMDAAGPAILATGAEGRISISAMEIEGANSQADGIRFEIVANPIVDRLRIRQVRVGLMARRTNQCSIAGSSIEGHDDNLRLTNCRGVTITGNFLRTGLGSNLVAEESQNLIIGANTFDHFADYDPYEASTAVRLTDCADSTLSGFVAQDGRLSSSRFSSHAPEPQGLIELVRCVRVNVTGVQILEAASCGMLLEDCRDTLVSGCTILDRRSPAAMELAICWRGAGSGNLVTGCRLGPAVGGAVAAEAQVRLWNNLPG